MVICFLTLCAALDPKEFHWVAIDRDVLPQHCEVKQLGHHVPRPHLGSRAEGQLLHPLLDGYRGHVGKPHVLPLRADVEVYEALVCGLRGVAQCGELFRHVAFNDGSKCCSNLVPKRPGVECGELPFHGLAYIPLCLILHRIECLDLEFTFAVQGRNIEFEFSSETLGTWNLSDAAMLIPITIDSHLATLPGVEDVIIIPVMVLCGVCESEAAEEMFDSK